MTVATHAAECGCRREGEKENGGDIKIKELRSRDNKRR